MYSFREKLMILCTGYLATWPSVLVFITGENDGKLTNNPERPTMEN